MRKSWTWIACGVAFVGAALLMGSQDAQARPQYLKTFNAEYPALKSQAETTKCGICHFGEKKTNRNDYGQAMGEALGKDAKNSKDEDKIKEALKKSEEGKSATEGKTFGDLLKDGKLPGKNP